MAIFADLSFPQDYIISHKEILTLVFKYIDTKKD